MMTVHEVSRLTGVSIRTLQYYDRIGLLPPAAYSDAGYRLYDDASLGRLQQILLFRELEFPLREIKAILQNPDYDRDAALAQQIELLTLRRTHLDNVISFARGLRQTGGENMDFSAFDTKEMDAYAAEVKRKWGNTDAYREFSEKSKGRTPQMEEALGRGLMLLFADFGKVRDADPACEQAQDLVRRLQAYITEHYYRCTPEILRALGETYGAGGAFTENIDKAGGEGTAAFAAQAIALYCGS